MSRKKQQAELREEDRVASEQLTITVAKGQGRKLKAEAKHKGSTVSAVVREALAQYPFVPRLPVSQTPGRGSGKTGRAKKSARVKRP